ncbi:hypothetical protein [Streptomyces sp. SYSU K217416]
MTSENVTDIDPLASVGYLEELRRLLHSAEHGGTGALALPGMDHPGVELGLGVLRPVLARAAGRVADVAISWMTPSAYLRDVLVPALAKGFHLRRRGVQQWPDNPSEKSATGQHES